MSKRSMRLHDLSGEITKRMPALIACSWISPSRLFACFNLKIFMISLALAGMIGV